MSFEFFDEVFKVMEKEGIVLNLYGEVLSDSKEGVMVMNVESRFLFMLRSLVGKYFKLKIVLEYCIIGEVVEVVREFGEDVVGIIVSEIVMGWGRVKC